jgi:hypothetical protein
MYPLIRYYLLGPIRARSGAPTGAPAPLLRSPGYPAQGPFDFQDTLNVLPARDSAFGTAIFFVFGRFHIVISMFENPPMEWV